MSDISKKLAISVIMLAIVLSMIFTFGIMQNVKTGKAPEVQQTSGSTAGEVSLSFTAPEQVNDVQNGEVSLTLQAPE